MTTTIPEATIQADLDVTVDTAELLAALTFVTGSITRTSTQLMILNGVLLTVAGDELHVGGFDYETCARQRIPAIGSGQALVTGRVLADVLKDLPKGSRLHLAIDYRSLVVSVVDDDLAYRFPLLPLEDYPTLPTVTTESALTFELTAEQMSRINAVTIAAGTDDTIPVLTTMQFSRNKAGFLEAACTDRYRLAVYDTGLPAGSLPISLVIGKQVNNVYRRFGGRKIGTLRLTFGRGPVGNTDGAPLVEFADDTRSITLREYEVSRDQRAFPDYARLKPARAIDERTVDAAALTTAVKQVAKVAARTSPVRFTFDAAGMTLEAGVVGEITATKRVLAAGTEEFATGFNPAYLLDGLATVGSDQVLMQSTEAHKPVLFSRPGDTAFWYLLMPVRLAN